MNSSDFYEFEGRRYVSPTVSRDDQLSFVDNLRNTMGQETQRIASQTENLGTNISSDLGRLGGSNSYFAQRYQTMPVENTVATLRATAQAKALNDLMSNYEAQAKNRYSQAYRRASNLGGSGSKTSEGGYETEEPEGLYVSSEDIVMPTEGWPEGTSVTGYGTANGYRYYRDASGNVLYTDNPDYLQGSNGYYYSRGVGF